MNKKVFIVHLGYLGKLVLYCRCYCCLLSVTVAYELLFFLLSRFLLEMTMENNFSLD